MCSYSVDVVKLCSHGKMRTGGVLMRVLSSQVSDGNTHQGIYKSFRKLKQTCTGFDSSRQAVN